MEPNGFNPEGNDSDKLNLNQIVTVELSSDQDIKDKDRLARIEEAMKSGNELSSQDIKFLYGRITEIQRVNSSTRLKAQEIVQQRDPKNDAPIVFDCLPEEVIWGDEQTFFPLNAKVYIGPLFPKMFQNMNSLEHIYTTFPERRIERYEFEAGLLRKETLLETIENNHAAIGRAIEMLRSPDFYTSTRQEELTLIKLEVSDLQLPKKSTLREIYNRAREFGLELCPPEVAPRLCLDKMNQFRNDSQLIAMKPINNSIFIYEKEDEKRSWVDAYPLKYSLSSEIPDIFSFVFTVAPPDLKRDRI